VYSMGCILFELLTGVLPFLEDSQVRMFRAHLMTPPPALSATVVSYSFVHDLEAIITRAMAKAPEARFPHAGEMLAALNALTAVVHRPKHTQHAPPPVAHALSAPPPLAQGAQPQQAALPVVRPTVPQSAAQPHAAAPPQTSASNNNLLV